MKPWLKTILAAVLITASLQAQFAEGQPVLRGAIGPAFSYMISLDLDDAAFAALSAFTPAFDLSDAANTTGINSSGMVQTGFEGFGEVTPHWTIGMYAGQGEYLASTQDAADVDYTVNFVLSSVGITAEFNTHSRSRLKLLAGSLFGIGQATLTASSSPANESWNDIIGGTSPRKAFELSAWTPVVQPYLGMRFDISRSMGFKTIAGWNEQVASAGSWKLYHNKVISDSIEVPLRALFFRLQLYVIL
ncbi:MAG: hypothetical protein HQ507_09810 [Candidatus Marinimicrobia bacterium]|nr:hypothetical protein [Candidatus Neomarinimicrobiota bacterium]